MKQKINNLISLFRKHSIIGLTVLFIAIIFGRQAYALELAAGLMSVLAGIFNLLGSVVGMIMVFLLKILVNVAQFNQFIYVEPVVYGWVVVRDICNMFFIVVLLIIAFATILQLDGYNWKKDVPKLVMAAILINFSKMFAGLMIDVSQVIMLTFVNAFAANGANNFALAFQVSYYKDLETGKDAWDTGNFSLALLVASVASFAAACITTVIVVVMIAAFVMRIVLLWIYIILSPLPYLLATFPQGKKYANSWWGDFSKELIAGPVLAFFTWLALTVAQMDVTKFQSGTSGGVLVDSTTMVMSGGTKLFTEGPFQKYLIVIGLLVGGLKIAGEAGGTFGGWAKKGSAWVNKGANWSKKKTLGAVTGTARFAGREVSDRIGLTGALMSAKKIKDQYKKDYASGRDGRVAASTNAWDRRFVSAIDTVSAPVKWMKKKHNQAGKDAESARSKQRVYDSEASGLERYGYDHNDFKNRRVNLADENDKTTMHDAVMKDIAGFNNKDFQEKINTEDRDYGNAYADRRSARELTYGGEKYSLKNNRWVSADGSTSFSNDEMDEHLNVLHQNKVEGIKKDKASVDGKTPEEIAKSDLYKKLLGEKHQQEINRLKQSAYAYGETAKVNEAEQKRRDNVLKWGTRIGGAVAGAATLGGGVPAALALTGLTGAVGGRVALDVDSAAEKVLKSGRQDTIKKKMDDMKEYSKDKVLDTIIKGGSPAEKMAALLVAAKNNYVDQEEVSAHQAELIKDPYFGGANEKDPTKFKDDKMQNLFNSHTSSQMKNEEDMKKAYDGFASLEDQQRALGNIMSKISNGFLKIGDLSFDRVQKSIDLFADALKPDEFKKQMDALPQGMKDATMKSLEQAIADADKSGNARKAKSIRTKLANYTKRPDKYFKGDMPGQVSFGQGITKGQWENLVKGEGVTDDQIKGMAESIAAAINSGGIDSLNRTMQGLLKQKGGNGHQLRVMLKKEFGVSEIKVEDDD